MAVVFVDHIAEGQVRVFNVWRFICHVPPSPRALCSLTAHVQDLEKKTSNAGDMTRPLVSVSHSWLSRLRSGPLGWRE